MFGIDRGISSDKAIILVAKIFLGDALLQYPVGYFVDRFGYNKVNNYCALVFFCCTPCSFLKLPLVILWSLMFILGGAAGDIYTLAIVRAGDAFNGDELISANASIGILWGVGGFIGLPSLGF